MNVSDESCFPATGMPDRDWWEILWPDPEHTLRKLGLRAGMAVVDLCCGDGWFTAALARIVDSGRVIGVDLDPALLERARQACHGAHNCSWIEGDARRLVALLHEPVDAALVANTFHGVPDKTDLARTVRCVLKPDGRFIVVNWHPIPRERTPVLGQPRGPATELRMAPHGLRAAVEPAGFALAQIIELPPYHYGAIFTKSCATD